MTTHLITVDQMSRLLQALRYDPTETLQQLIDTMRAEELTEGRYYVEIGDVRLICDGHPEALLTALRPITPLTVVQRVRRWWAR